MRYSFLLAVLLAAAVAVPARAQDTFCRIYQTMTLGDGVACFYCLKCTGCTTPTAFLGAAGASTGGCSVCGPHCFPARLEVTAPEGDSKRGTVEDENAKNWPKVPALKREPSVLYDPERTKNLGKWIVSMQIPQSGKTVKLFVVTGSVSPPNDVDPLDVSYPPETLGFGREIKTGLHPHATATDVENLQGGFYRFAFLVGDIKYKNCIGVIEVQ